MPGCCSSLTSAIRAPASSGIFENMAKIDALNQFTTHVGSGLFACPGGIGEGQFLAQGLFDAA